jgi:hypothetical protein
LFGHIHDTVDFRNNGIRIINDITFINGSCVTDGRISTGNITNGQIINIWRKQ